MGSFQGSVLGALRTLLGWDGTDFQNVKVDSSGHLQIDVLSNVLGGDQATETSLQGIEDQVKDTLLNIKDYLFDYTSTTASGANFTGYATSVPSGEIWHITTIMAFNVTRAATQIRIGTRIGASTLWFFDDSSPVLAIQSTWNGHIWLGVDDEVAVYITGCQADDVIRFALWGHKITV